mmetsp:Transcript_15402/g.27969  ORF Transcript_15402/g.27969 Transcript_15402/m.27969 type:complete len:97 (+) Transcript_15402:485-775(+)
MPQEDRDTMTYAAGTAIEKIAMDVIFPSLVSAGVGEGDDYENSSAESFHSPNGQRPFFGAPGGSRIECRTILLSPTRLSRVHSIQVQDDIYHDRTT